MDVLLAFAAALLALRLGGLLAARWRARRSPELAAWAAGLVAYGAAAAAMAWGAAYGWGPAAFRVYYLFGGMLTAALLGAGSLLLTGRRWAAPAVLFYAGIAVGVALAVPLHGAFPGSGIPEAQEHLDAFPARVLAIVGNAAGTLALVLVAVATIRRRPLGNALILLGTAVAALGTAVAGLGIAQSAVFVALAAVLLYGGFTWKSVGHR